MPLPGCCVPSPVILVRLRVPQSVVCHLCRPPCTFNESASLHSCVCSHSCCCDTHRTSCECSGVFTPTAPPRARARALQRAPFLASSFWGVFWSGWHRDRGSHATRSVFSKTAEDSLAHVTTASRLTCYHGDKPANENSADSCDVDCELFVLRGDLFFPPLSPLPPAQLLRRRPFYSLHVRPDVGAHQINMPRPLAHTCTRTYSTVRL